MLHLAHSKVIFELRYVSHRMKFLTFSNMTLKPGLRAFTSARCCRVTLPPQISRQTDLVSTFVVAAAAVVALALVALAARETTVASY